MLEKPLISHYARVASVKSAIIEALGLLDPAQTNLTPLQSFLLAAIVLDRRPDAIVDLGTGTGCSSATLAIAAGLTGCGIVETFDYADRWGSEIAPKLLTINRTRWAPIRQHVGDLTRFDFAALLRNAQSAFIFWDAHGFEVAEAVLGKIMPVVSEKPHLVVCHDVVDNRFPWPTAARQYGGKRFWRGMDDWYRNSARTNYLNIGWCNTLVDQILPILDFCYRNQIELGSADYDIHGLDAWESIATDLGVSASSLFQMAYFCLEGTKAREFPAIVPNEPELSACQSLKFQTVPENDAKITELLSGEVQITLPRTPWTYVARLAPSVPLPGQAGVMVVGIRVVSGSAAVGVLKQDGSDFLTRKMIHAGPEPVDVHLKLADWRLAGPLLVETAAEVGGGEVIVSSLAFAPTEEKHL